MVGGVVGVGLDGEGTTIGAGGIRLAVGGGAGVDIGSRSEQAVNASTNNNDVMNRCEDAVIVIRASRP